MHAKVCCMCNKFFRNIKKVRVHCHFTDKYPGADESICNIRNSFLVKFYFIIFFRMDQKNDSQI